MAQIAAFEIVHEYYVAMCRTCRNPNWEVKGFTGGFINGLLAWEAEAAVREHVRQTGHVVDGIHRREVKWQITGESSRDSSRKLHSVTSTSPADT